MLNRRILRVKAMQALYAFHQMKEANKEVVRNLLANKYAPDLNSSEVQDKEALNKQKAEALSIYDDFFSKEKKAASESADSEIIKDVNNSLSRYHKMVTDDEDVAKKHMLQELDKIHFHYLKLLLLAQEFAALDQRDADKIAASKHLVQKGKNNLKSNPYFLAFSDFKSLELLVI